MTPSWQRWLNHTNLTLHFRERCCDSTSALRQESIFRKFSSTCNFLKFVVRFCIQFSILQSPSLNCPVSLSWSADSASSVRSFLAFFFPRSSSGAVGCFLCVKNEQGFGCTPGQRASLMPAAAIYLLLWLHWRAVRTLSTKITLLGKTWVRDDALLRLPFMQYEVQTFTLAPGLGCVTALTLPGCVPCWPWPQFSWRWTALSLWTCLANGTGSGPGSSPQSALLAPCRSLGCQIMSWHSSSSCLEQPPLAGPWQKQSGKICDSSLMLIKLIPAIYFLCTKHYYQRPL